MGKEKKPRKEKITYIDDGRTIADMSAVTGRKSAGGGNNSSKSPQGLRYRASLKEQAGTFFAAMKMMFVPMLVVICAIIIIYMLMSLLFWIM